jgi:glycosyltransferase involved in cell wall biosynthesis
VPGSHVLWQAVPRPKATGAEQLLSEPRSGQRLIIGRICTPQARKWPAAIIPFYAELTRRLPRQRLAQWEFVGCPAELQPRLLAACGGQAVFHSAGWQQRHRLADWDVLLYSHPNLPESFGRTVAEAMRAGCIPVVDRLGGFVEQVPAGCGFLCDGIDDFAAALAKLSEAAARHELSQAAQHHANEKFSLRRFAKVLLAWLDRAGAWFRAHAG